MSECVITKCHMLVQESEGMTGGIMTGIQSLHNWMSAQAKINPKLVNKKNLEDEEEQSVEVRICSMPIITT